MPKVQQLYGRSRERNLDQPSLHIHACKRAYIPSENVDRNR